MFLTWFRTLALKRMMCAARRRPLALHYPPLMVQPLEDRAMPATLTVTTFDDDALPAPGALSPTGSLREVIVYANNNPGNHQLTLGVGTYWLTLNGAGDIGDVDIASGVTLTIVGAGAGQTIIDAGGDGGSHGALNDRVFQVLGGGSLTVTNATITGGAAVLGAGILVDSTGTLALSGVTLSGNTATTGGGGGIAVSGGSATISNSAIANNKVNSAPGGGLYKSGSGTLTVTNTAISGNSATKGGGIYDVGSSVIVSGSTISGNVATTGAGGGIYDTGSGSSVTVTNSTISGNQARTFGGGVYVKTSGATATIANSTITGNTANKDNDTPSAFGGGASRVSSATLTVNNTIVAGNFKASTANDFGPAAVSGGSYNLIGDPSTAGGLTDGDANHNIVGSGGSTIDITTVLSGLAPNGGPTQTHALVTGSPAVDAGNPAYSGPLTTDQRGAGYARIVHSRIDIGAFEVQVSPATAGFDGFGNLVLTDTEGLDDNFTISYSGGMVHITNPAQLLSGPGTGPANSIAITLAADKKIIVNGGTGNDNLIIDLTGGKTLPSGGLDFAGGTGSNGMSILGGSFNTVIYNYTNAHDGSIQFGATGPLASYTGLAPLFNGATAADIIVNLPAAGAVGASLQSDGTAGNNMVQLASTNATFEITTFTVPTNSLTVNAGTGGTTITTTSDFSGDFNAALSIVGGTGDSVTLNALTLGASGANSGNLTVTANTITVSGAINTTAGTAGAISMTASQNIVVSANMTGGAGGVSLSANQQAPRTSGDFGGVVVQGGAIVSATGTGAVSVYGRAGAGVTTGQVGVTVQGAGSIITSGGGSVTVTGVGGSAAGNINFNYGVYVFTGGLITAGGTGAVVVNGTGGTTTGTTNTGVRVAGASALITSGGGNVQVTGQAGNRGFGVHLEISQGISAGGTGTVTVQGTGNSAAGVRLSTSTITSGGGNVVVSGQGGSVSILNIGVEVSSSVITAGGTGTVTVTGTGGNAAGDTSAFGVQVRGTGSITSGGGPVSVTASTGTSSAVALTLDDTGAITSGGSASITITADSVSIDSTAAVNSGTGTTTIRPLTAGTQIDLGGADALTGSPLTLGLDAAELGRITAGTFQVGGTASGAITVSQPLTSLPAYHLSLTSGAGIDFTASVTMAPEKNLTGNAVDTIAVASSLTTSGTGAISLTTARNMVVSSGTVSTVSGGLTLSANQQATASSGNFVGINVNGATVTTTGGGNVLLQGRGGNSGSANYGVRVQSAGVVSGSGTVTVEGTGGASLSSSNIGVYVVNPNAQITSGGGAVLVKGTGGGAGSSNSNYGVYVEFGGVITSAGTGSGATVTVEGQGGNTASVSNRGVFVVGADSQITSGGGAVSVTGIGTSASEAVRLQDNGRIASGNNAAITVTADSVNILSNSGGINSGTGTTTIRTRTAGTLIDLGGTDVLSGSPLTLGLTSDELNQITAGTLVIGGTAAGAITVSGTIIRPANTHVELRSGGAIVFNPGSINTAGGNLLLAPGGTGGTGGVRPLSSGTDITTSAGTASFASQLTIAIGGTAADSGYDRLGVSGAVDLTGVDLYLSGGYTPAAGDVFTIVSATSRTGQFNGLDEGDTLTLNGILLKVAYTATAVTLTVVPPAAVYTWDDAANTLLIHLNSDAAVTVSESGGTVTFTLNAGWFGRSGGDLAPGDETGTITLSSAQLVTSVMIDNTLATAGTNDVTFSGAGVLSSATIIVGITDPDAVGSIVFTGGFDMSVAAGLSLTTVRDIRIGSGSLLTASGTGGITLSANQQGTATSGNFTGILIDNASVSATLGDISLAGRGGTGGGVGVRIKTGTITGGGAGTLTTITGTAGANDSHGVLIDGPPASTVSSNGGAIVVTGRWLGGSSGFGISVQDGSTLGAGGGVPLTLVTDTLEFAVNVNVTSGTATTTIRPLTPGQAINLGGADGTAALGLSGTELGRITAGTLQVGGTATGQITVSAALTSLPSYHLSLTSGTGIEFAAAVTMAANKNLTATAGSTISVSAGTGLASSGTGAISLTTPRNIVVSSGTVSTVNGDLTLSANQQATAASGNFVGIDLDGASITVTGTGAIRLGGRGGDSGANNYGVYLLNGAVVSGGPSGLTSVNGRGGASSDNYNYGVWVTDASTRISSVGGPVAVEGTGGGSGISGFNYGVIVENGAAITSMGTAATVAVHGAGGTTTGAGNYGVVVWDTGSQITSGGGAVTVEGTGGGTGASSENVGVRVSNGGAITSAGTGAGATVTVHGTGGNASGADNYGIWVFLTGSQITSGGAAIEVAGGAGGGPTGYGIYVEGGGRILGTTGTPTVTLAADSMELLSTSAINAGANTVVLRPLTPGTLINLGGADVLSGSPLTLGLDADELGRITAGTLQVGGTASGQITVSAALTSLPVYHLSLTSGGGVTVNQAVTMAANKGLTVNAVGTIGLPNGTSDITASGTGAISLTTVHNIALGSGASLTTADGNIALSANQQATASSGNFVGIDLNGATIIVTGSGAISLAGRGGDSGANNHGDYLHGGAVVSGGTSGAVEVSGRGGVSSGNTNFGVFIEDFGSRVSSAGGAVTVAGTGGGTSTSVANYGLAVGSGGAITSAGTGAGATVTVRGTGGGDASSGGANYGVFVVNPDSRVRSSGGAVTVEGVGGAGDGSVGIRVDNFGQVVGSAGTASVTLIADSMELLSTATSVDAGGNTVVVRPRTAGTLIDLGGADVLSGSPLTLGLDAGELGRITAGTLQVGGTANGSITVSAALTSLPAYHLSLTSGTSIAFNQAVTMAPNKNLAASAVGPIDLPNSTSDLNASGTGAISLTTARYIALGSDSSITATDGGITLSANQQVSPSSGNFVGIDLFQASITVSGSGTLSLRGRGGDSGTANHGVLLRNTSVVTGGSSGTASVTGFGGASIGNVNNGVYVDGTDTRVTSTGGAVLVEGTGGGTGASTDNYGVRVQSGGMITSAGTGAGATVTVRGAGGNSIGDGNYGVFIFASSAQISSDGGAVLVEGTGGGTGASNSNYGVWVTTGGEITSAGTGAGATVTVRGVGGNSTGGSNYGVIVSGAGARVSSGGGAVLVDGTGGGTASHGIRMENSGQIVGSAGTEGVTLLADSIDLINPSLVDAGANTVVVRPRTAGTLIDLGGADVLSGSPLTLGLDADELGRITAGTLQVGGTASGQITVSAALTPLPAYHLSLTSGTGIAFNQAVTMAVNKNLTASAVGTISLPNATSDLIAGGTGSISLTTARNITVGNGTSASITAADGNITLSANQQATASSGNFVGIDLTDGDITVSGSGALSLIGRGGDSGSSNHGVRLQTTAVVTGGSSGTATVTGYGGASSGNANVGVYVDSLGTRITSAGGAVLVEGTGGGTGASDSDYGVFVSGGGEITSAGAGAGATVTVRGVGGNSTGGNDVGVFVSGSGSRVRSSGGAVLVVGTGGGTGASNSNIGVNVNGGGEITSAGAGAGATVTVRGGGGNSTGGSNYGVYVFISGSRVSSGGGAVLVEGTGGGTTSAGIRVASDGQIVGSTGTAGVTLIADSMNLLSSSFVDAGANTVVVQPRTAGTLIDLGGADVLSGSPLTLGLDADELGRITAGTLQVGGTASGQITVSAALTPLPAYHLSLTSGTGIAFNQAVTMAVNKNLTASAVGTISLPNATSDLIAGGTGSISLTTARNITVGNGTSASITAADGNITLSANQQATASSGNFVGIDLTDGDITVSGSGALSLIGRGGDSGSSNHGVRLQTTAVVTGGSSGTATVTGYGGASSGNANVGVYVDSLGTRITSAGGAVLVEGTGGGTGASDSDYGVFVSGGGEITSAGAGAGATVTVRGVGGNSTGGSNYGVIVSGAGARVSSGGGAVLVDGTGGGTASHGIRMENSGQIVGSAGTEGVTLLADSIDLINPSLVDAGANTVVVRPRTAGTLIDLGGADVLSGSPLTLGLDAGELSRITAGTLQVGGTASGAITVSAALTSLPAYHLSLTSGTGIAFNQAVMMAVNKNLTASAVGTISLPNATSDLIASGTGSISLTTARNITVGNGTSASITAADGNITLSANQQATASSGNFVGIDLTDGDITVTGSGALSLIGRGGDSGSSNHGVRLQITAVVTGGSSGTATVTGYGGASSGNANVGVYVDSLGTRITSAGGAVLVEGTGGGTGASDSDYGVFVSGGGEITSAGAGAGATVTVRGVGCHSTGGNDVGVFVSGSGSRVSSGGGAVLVVGTGGGTGASNSNIGVNVNGGGEITSAGAGAGATVTVRGGGGNSTGGSNYGVIVSGAGARVSSGGGAVLVEGTGGGTTSAGIRVASDGQIVGSTGTAGVTLIADSMNLLSSSFVDAGANTVVVQPRTAGTLIDLGGADVLSGSPLTLGLDADELGRITAGTLQVGGTASGQITVSAALTPLPAYHLSLTSGTGIAFNQAVTMAVNKNLTASAVGTISLPNATSDLIAGGTGAISLTTVHNIALGSGASLTTADGNIALSANQQGISASGNFIGIDLNNAAVTVTGSGTLSLRGRGGDSGSFNHGVQVRGGAAVTGGSSGTASVTGIAGGTGTNNFGVSVDGSGSRISSGGGAVLVVGTGGGGGAGNSNYGVDVINGGEITSAGTGVGATVTVRGVGGNTDGINNFGVFMNDSGSRVSSGGGAVLVEGTGGTGAGGSNSGVSVNSGAEITGAGTGATVTVRGAGGTAVFSSNIGVTVSGASARIRSSGGAVLVDGTGGGGAGTGSSNYGVWISTGGEITNAGTGTGAAVTVRGAGGNTTGGSNIGVIVDGTGSRVSSNGGAVLVEGTSAGTGGGGNNFGVRVSFGGEITSAGTGAGAIVTVRGTGGNSTGGANYGVSVVSTGSRVTSGGGAIVVEGTGGGTASHGIRLESSGQIVGSAGTAGVTLRADSMALLTTTTSVDAGGNTAVLRPLTAGTLINLGGNDVLTGSPKTLGLDAAELGRITAGILVIGGTAAGAINVSSAVNTTIPVLVLQTGATVGQSADLTGNSLAVQSAGTAALSNSGNHFGTVAFAVTNGDVQYTDSGNFTVGATGGVTGVSTGTGSVTLASVSGSGAITVNRAVSASGTAALNAPTVNLNADVSGAAITGTATMVNIGATAAQIQDGVAIATSGGSVNVTVAGTFAENVTINKVLRLVGPNSSGNPVTGSRVAEAIISAPGGTGIAVAVSAASGAVSIQGFSISGGTGIALTGGAALAVTNNIIISPSTAGSTGVYASAGSATVTNNRISGAAVGVRFTTGASGSVGGNDFATGTANGTDLFFDASSGTAAIADGNLFGAATTYIDNRSARNYDLSNYTTFATTRFGGVLLSAATTTDQMYPIETRINDKLDNASFGLVRLRANNVYVPAGASIQLGVNASGTGGIVNIQSGSFPTQNVDTTAGGVSVTLSPGSSPGQVDIGGNLATNADDTILFEINGPSPASSSASAAANASRYDNLIVHGTVNLGGAKLNIVLGYDPAPGDAYTLIDNQSSGTSGGGLSTTGGTALAEGAVLTVNGPGASPLQHQFSISYAGGTGGNDVVLTFVMPNSPPVISVGAGDRDAVSLMEGNTGLMASGTLTVTDANADTVTAAVTAFFAAGLTGGLPAAVLQAYLAVNSPVLAGGATVGKLTWTFNSGTQAFDFLAADEPLTLTYAISFEDGRGGTAARDVTITITGANDAAAIGGDDTRDLVEVDTAAAISTSGRLTIADVDGPAAFEPASNVAGLYGHFSISADGRWTYTADSAHDEFALGEVYTDVLTARAADGTEHAVTIRITGRNDAPVITVGPGDSAAAALTEGDAGLTASGTLSVSDPDLTDTVISRVQSFTATGPNGGLSNTTLLGFLTVNPLTVIDGAHTAGKMTWVFNSGTQAFDYLAAGQTLTLAYAVWAIDSSATLTSHDEQLVTITITGANDVPVMTTTAGDVASVTLLETDAGLTATGQLTVADPDVSDIVTASVAAVNVSGPTGGLSNQTLLGFLSVGPSPVIDAAHTSGALTWAFNSGAEAFDFLTVGQSLVLAYTVRATDNSGAANNRAEQTVTVAITGTNDAPTLSGLESTALAFTEKSPAIPVTAALTVGNVDSPSLSGAMVAITAGYVNGEDVLAYAQPSGNPITGSFNATTGVLTLTGPGTPAQFEAALRAVTYRNTSDNPSIAPRTLSFQVDDGAAANNASAVATRALAITAVNDPPAITAPAAVTTPENSGLVFHSISVTDVDAGAGALAVTLTAAHGTLSLGSTANLGGLSGNGTAAVTFTGTLAAVNAALDGLTFTPDVNYSGPANVGVAVNDQGNTGTGGPAPASKLIAVTIQAFPRITGVQVGPAPDDDPNQRSRINRLLVSFSEGLTVHPDAAFTLVQNGTTAVPLTVTWDTASQATLTFSGVNFVDGSLTDGNYRLSVDGGLLTGVGGLTVDGDGDHGAGGVFTTDFYRLFGDANGDRVVNGGDVSLLGLQFGSTNPTFDANGDGVFNGGDLQAFIDNFGRSI